MAKKYKLSDIAAPDLKAALDNALLDCVGGGRRHGETAWCELGVNTAYDEVKKVKIERIKDLLAPRVNAMSRCKNTKVFGRPLHWEDVSSCNTGVVSLIARLTRALSIAGRKKRR